MGFSARKRKEAIRAALAAAALLKRASTQTMKPYQVLGIEPDASHIEAKQAYRRLAQVHHPDRVGGNIQRFQEIHKAYEAFKRTATCLICGGKGYTETRSGLAVNRSNCPDCWKGKNRT